MNPKKHGKGTSVLITNPVPMKKERWKLYKTRCGECRRIYWSIDESDGKEPHDEPKGEPVFDHIKYHYKCDWDKMNR